VVRNDRITRAIPGWAPERIEDRIGIAERRFLWDFDEGTGRAIPPAPDAEGPRSNVDMAEIAVRQALDRAGLRPQQLDAVFLVTTTPDELSFCRDAVELHHRLGCRSDAIALTIDSGCGGAVYVADLARKLILSGRDRTIAVVASNFTSPYMDREVFTSPMPGKPRLNAFLTMYIFGDGAGALILRGDEGTRLGVVASTAATDHPELVIHRAGGAQLQPSRATMADHAFFMDGPLVAEAYPLYMHRAMEELRAAAPEVIPEIRRYYLHQANRRIVLAFAEQERMPLDRVPLNINRYGNTSAASTLLLFSEDLEEGRVKLGSGDPVLFAAAGAGVHFGGQIVRV
jgi:3-oxoacyl-[acyl-carrier-protein] synthase III